LIAQSFMAISAGIVLLLGAIHFVYTFRGDKLTPRDAALLTRMSEVSPVISRETTMWRAWIGFNASHSFGALLFGVIYGYLAIRHADLLFDSPFLLAVGLVVLTGYVVLGRLYWFSVPFRSICIAALCYIVAIVFSRT
jgi:hypothetical protein